MTASVFSALSESPFRQLAPVPRNQESEASRCGHARAAYPHVTSQMRAVLSSETVTTRPPSGLKPAPQTGPVWPFQRRTREPFESRQSSTPARLDSVPGRPSRAMYGCTPPMPRLTQAGICRLVIHPIRATLPSSLLAKSCTMTRFGSCVYRKPKPGRSGDGAHPGWETM
jgi:hypothetical protein